MTPLLLPITGILILLRYLKTIGHVIDGYKRERMYQTNTECPDCGELIIDCRCQGGE